MKLPDLSKRIAEILPWSRRLFRQGQKLFVRTAVTSLGALTLGPIPPQSSATVESAPATTAITVLNRERRSPLGKLVLRLTNDSGGIFAAHRSHSSHSSHRSHSSHSSHYSSSSGSPRYPTPSPPAQPPKIYKPTTPDPEPLPTPPAPAPAPSSPPKYRVLSPTPDSTVPSQPLQYVVLEITSVDLGKRRVKGIDKQGHELELHFLFNTPLRRLTPRETTISVLDAAARTYNGLPFQINDEVLIYWYLEPSSQQRMVQQFTVY